jgi:hypothetical protein
MTGPLLRFAARLATAASLIAMPMATGVAANPARPVFADPADRAVSDCHLKSAEGNIQHLIWLQFDNVHFTRDNPNVPSDLEQMPNLLNFIENNGTLLSNHHTPLIAHTADDILTTLTGVYGDRHGVSVANSYRYFKPDGSSGPASSFTYWTDPLFDFAPKPPINTDTTFNMLAANGENAPAPWVPFTRAGCNVGAVGTANIELENVTADVPVVFGANSPEALEAASNPDQASADFIGVSVHCSRDSDACQAGHARPDLLPDERGGYNGFQALFGHKNVAPIISPNTPLKDLNGTVIDDGNGHVGFPGFDGMVPAVSLAYVAAMQEHGVPITFNYVSAAHDAQRPFGPGEADYESRLKSFDDAFGKFFTRLQADGITPANTLFMFTADEGDHLIAGAPNPPTCDGVTTPCTYSQIGEVSGNLTGLLATNQHITTPFTVHSDSAPTVYITGNPAQDGGVTRTFERGLANVTAINPYSGKTEQVANFVADQVEMGLLHMVTADPARTPTVTLFAKPDYFLFTGAPNCNSACTSIDPGFNWNHGTVAPEINTTWLGLAGPGIRKLGVDSASWTDHTDTRPTVLSLLGLRDDYQQDGRVIFEILTPRAMPEGLEENRGVLTRLAHVYKQLNGAVGAFGLDSLSVATSAVSSGNSSQDTRFHDLEGQLKSLTNQRNSLARQMIALLNGAAFHDRDFSADQANDLSDRGEQLLGVMADLAANP